MFFSRVKPIINSEEICGGLTGYTRQLLLMFQMLCQLMTKCLFVNCHVFRTELCKEETTSLLHKVVHKTCMRMN